MFSQICIAYTLAISYNARKKFLSWALTASLGGGGARAPSPVPGSGTGQVAYLVRSPLFMAVIEELSHTTSNCPYVSLKKKRRNNGPHREQKMFYFSNLTSFLRNVGKQCRIIQMYLKQVLLRLGCCAICYFPNLKNI